MILRFLLDLNWTQVIIIALLISIIHQLYKLTIWLSTPPDKYTCPKCGKELTWWNDRTLTCPDQICGYSRKLTVGARDRNKRRGKKK